MPGGGGQEPDTVLEDDVIKAPKDTSVLTEIG